MFQGLVNYYNELKTTGDPRSSHLPMIQDPIWVVGAAIFYLAMVTMGPKFMANKQAWSLRNVLVGYNLFSVILSLWMMWEVLVTTVFNPDFSLLCQPTDTTDRSPLAMRLVNAHWWYFFSKIIEFSDTLFFIIRKKNNQISFLHVYHHVSMLFLQWSLVKIVPGGISWFGPLCNCFIHAVMYTYYGLSAIGPHMQKYLWWKRYLTKMQMGQFILIFLYCSNAISDPNTDPLAKSFFWFSWFYMISLFYLFNHFYQQSYKKASKSSKSISDEKPASVLKKDE